MLKRFKDNELGESASRRVGYHCTTDYAKSSKAQCRVCDTNIEQGELRLALMLQDIEGYKSKSWTHFDCFWKHPETTKLNGTHEIHDFSKLKHADQTKITKAFETFNAKKSKSKKKRNNKDTDDDDEEEEYSPEKKSVAKKVTNKRKRGCEDD